jgi:predicted DCC family thiol-disulfide oxidoreductase YuxK
MLTIQLGFLFLLNFADLTIGMLLFHLYTFNPAWIPARPFAGNEILYYDGNCAMCHGFVRFLLAEERTRTLRYGPLQGQHFRTSVPAAKRSELPDSLVLSVRDGHLRVRSDAVVRVMERMGGLWTASASLLRLVPRPLRDAGYDLAGALRYRLFGRTTDACPLIPPTLRKQVMVD